MSEWEEDADEYIRKNLPSDIVWTWFFLLLFYIICCDFWLEFYVQDEICGWREDLFTSRKSAVNLLGVISMSKVTSW